MKAGPSSAGPSSAEPSSAREAGRDTPSAPPRAPASALARDVVVLGLIWGSSVVFQRIAVAEIESVPLIALRLLAAVAFFLPFLPRVWRGLAGSPRRLFDVGFTGALNPTFCGILSGLALQFASSGLVAVLISLGPLFTALLAKLTLDEPPLGRKRLGGLAVAFGGVALLIATRSTGLGDGADGDLRGHALALTIALAMAVAAVYARRHLAGVDPLAGSAGQNMGGLLLIGPVAVLLAGTPVGAFEPGAVSRLAWLAIVASGTFGLGGSFVLYLGLIARHGPTAAMLALYVMPIFATVLGAIFLGETITAPMAAGAALVLAGVVLFTCR